MSTKLFTLATVFALLWGSSVLAGGICTTANDPCTIDADCDDGIFCTGIEFCDDLAGPGFCECGPPPDCSDSFACTIIDGCGDFGELTDQCLNIPEHSICDDFQFCNGAESCDPGNVGADGDGCVMGDPPCVDGIACTDDLCDESTGCDNPPNDANCSNDLFCDGEETCDPVNGCMDGTPPCSADQVCDEDEDECRGCVTAAECSDGVFCNGVEACVVATGMCESGNTACDDGVDCTIDICDEANQSCTNTPDDSLCDNGDACDGAETCDQASGCLAGTPLTCDDGDPCNGVETCNQSTGCESGTPLVCEDGDVCNGIAVCVEFFGCVDGPEPDCNDDVDCTVDTCDPLTGCDSTPDDSLCDNGQFCDGAESCDTVDDCLSGTPPDCDDGVDCTIDSCDDVNDVCVHTPDVALCDDGVLCTTDVCDPLSGCANTPDDGACDNGTFCDGDEFCDPVNGCRNGTPPDCDDGVSCTVDTCDAVNDTCEHTPDDALCDDGQFCTGVETCDPINDCQTGTAPSCNDGFNCTVDTCDPAAGGFCVNTPTDSLCSDVSACNGVEVCEEVTAGVFQCAPGPAVNCDDDLNCTFDECIEPTGTCRNTADDAFCDDFDFCNGVETCNPDAPAPGSGCEAGTLPDCNDLNICTTDTCENDACRHEPIANCIPPTQRRVSMTQKGSLLMFSKIEIKWDNDGRLLQDTFIDITNDYPRDVDLLVYFINGDEPIEEIREEEFPFRIIRDAEPGWNTANCRFKLTGNQPAFWSAAMGGSNCQSFAVLDYRGPGRPDPETDGVTRVLRGYMIAWAVRFNAPENEWQEIRWNHLKGDAVLVNYDRGTAWEYNAWSFQAHEVAHSAFLGTPGLLVLDSREYDTPFGTLLLDFYGSGSFALSGDTVVASIDTDLTLHPVSVDLRQDGVGPIITKAEIDIWNELESKFSGTRRCIQCWDQTLVSNYATSVVIPNHFTRSALHTDKGKARIEGVASTECDNRPPFYGQSEAAALLGLAAKIIDYSNGSSEHSTAGMSLVGMAVEPAEIVYDPEQGPDGLLKGGDPMRDARNPRGVAPQEISAKNATTEREGRLRDDDVPEE